RSAVLVQVDRVEGAIIAGGHLERLRYHRADEGDLIAADQRVQHTVAALQEPPALAERHIHQPVERNAMQRNRGVRTVVLPAVEFPAGVEQSADIHTLRNRAWSIEL